MFYNKGKLLKVYIMKIFVNKRKPCYSAAFQGVCRGESSGQKNIVLFSISTLYRATSHHINTIKDYVPTTAHHSHNGCTH